MGSRYYGFAAPNSDWDFFQADGLTDFSGWHRQPNPGFDKNLICYYHRGTVQVKIVKDLRTQIVLRNYLGPLYNPFPKSFRPLLMRTFDDLIMMLHQYFDEATKQAVEFCVQQGCWPMGSRYYGTNAPDADWDFFDQYSDDLKQKFLADGWQYSGPGTPPDNALCFFRKGEVQVQLVEDLKIQIMLRNCLRYWLTMFPKSHRHVVIWSFYTIIQQTLLPDEKFFADPRNTDKTLKYSDLDFWRQ